jgi:hypothetical protein
VFKGRIRHLTWQAIDAFFNDPQAQSSASAKGDQARVKKLGDVWEKYKGKLVFPVGVIIS